MRDDKYMIYQLKAGDELHYHRFEPLDRLRAAGLAVERGNYERVYTGALDEHGQWPMEKMLAALYFQFNVNHPADFTGHSLSISDIVVLRQDDRVTAHYVDSGFDFSEVPEFLEGPYLYYSTQRPVDLGTFPRTEGGPVQIENYDKREPVEGGSFKAWGRLEYSAPLTKSQADAYELRPSSQNPNCFITPPCQQEARLYVVAGWEHAGHIAEKQRITEKQPDGSYALKDPSRYWMVKMRFDRIMSGRAKQPSIAGQDHAVPEKRGPGMSTKDGFEIARGHERMKVLLVKPNEYAVEAEIENSLKALQKAVGGHIEVFTPGSDPVVYVLNEEGKIMGLDANRALYDNRGNLFDVAVGTFLVCGVKGDDFTDLSPDLMAKYKKQFHAPEIFAEQGGKIMAIKIDPKKSIADQLAQGAKLAAQEPPNKKQPPKDRGDR